MRRVVGGTLLFIVDPVLEPMQAHVPVAKDVDGFLGAREVDERLLRTASRSGHKSNLQKKTLRNFSEGAGGENVESAETQKR